MRVRDVECLSSEAPAQFQAKTDDDRPVYVRFRGDWLTVEVGLPGVSPDGLPGDGYIVVDEEATTDAGDQCMTWEQVERIIAPIDLPEVIGRLAALEAGYRRRWASILDGARRRDVGGTALWTLVLEQVPWDTTGMNRIDRFGFEQAFGERGAPGVCSYVHDADFNGVANRFITVLVSEDLIASVDGLILGEAGARAFGGVEYGTTGGVRRGDARCVGTGDPELAFELIARRLAEMKPAR